MKKIWFCFFSLILSLFLNSCKSIVSTFQESPTYTPTTAPIISPSPTIELVFTETPLPPTIEVSLTPTPDICAPENIGTEIEEIHKIMRTFEDASLLASNTPNQQLYSAIADLQRIRREAEYLKAPACLDKLKKLQLTHMETVINIMMAFYTGTNAEIINTGILQARQEHDAYTLELVELLGGLPLPGATQVAEEITPTTIETPVLIANLTVTLKANLNAANMRDAPSRDSTVINWLGKNQEADVFGQNEDGSWFLLSIPSDPDKRAWVAFSALEIVAGDKETLPVLTPTPIIETEQK